MSAVGSDNYDVIVMGGGPAGSSVAALVASQGHRVLVLERERFPRHQIGESLLPSTIHGTCRLLGVSEELEKAGFVRKLGGTFRWGKNPEPWQVPFGLLPILGEHKLDYAFQVERARFDTILLNNARKKGAEVREQQRVTELLREGERVAGVRFTDERGREQEVRARFVVDASGNTSRFAALAGQRVYSEFFKNAALYAYFRGGKRLAPPFDGNIFICAFNEGWFWYIPLTAEMTSVGVVMSREVAAQLKQGHEETMRRFIDACPTIKDMLSSATRITEGMYGEFRVRRDWSYINTRFWAPGLVLVGDAACFVDPIFSSGVHLATYGALLAARSLNTTLRKGDALGEQRCLEEFDRRYRREYGNWYNFALGFYDMHQDEQSYYFNARKILRTEEQANDAFVRMCSGLSTTGEPLYTDARAYFQDRVGVGTAVEKLLHERKPESYLQLVHTKLDPSKITKNQGLVMESQDHVLTHSLLGAQALQKGPLYEGGLAISADGRYWDEGSAS